MSLAYREPRPSVWVVLTVFVGIVAVAGVSGFIGSKVAWFLLGLFYAGDVAPYSWIHFTTSLMVAALVATAISAGIVKVERWWSG